ncbi:MAG: flagellar hook-associated protein FlgL [Thermodesulfobacteriota bacterium]
MLYRVSQRSLFRSINTNLGMLTWDLAKLTNQISSGKKVNKPSDDPSGGATILAMRTILADVDQYYKDVSLADDWLKQTESVLQSMKDVVEHTKVLCEQMATDTYRSENMDVAADDVALMFESLIKMGNTRIGDRYIFAGQKTEIKPFVQDLTIWDAVADSGNSTLYTGEMLVQGDRTFNPRSDIARQTQVFLFEVTSAGGVFKNSGYSLARLTLDPAGDHNALFFEASGAGGWAGTSGNALTIEYVVSATATSAAVSVAGAAITVTLVTSGSAITTTALEVMDLLNHHASASAMVTVSLADGNAGSGPLTAMSAASLSGGYDTAAMFRVSQDGGQTWSVQNAFTALDFKGADLYYNPQLGHANYTTNFRGYGNDLYFVADQMGSWGNDIHLQFLTDKPAGSALSVDFDPPGSSANPSNNWVITVHLETSASLGGAVVSTAYQVMSAINHHASASAVVTVGLADYREGGNGYVDVLELTSLQGGDRGYTELGHASYTTDFEISAGGLDPNVQFTALTHGTSGDNIQIEYVLGSAGVTTWVDNPPLSAGVVTVHLEVDSSGRVVAMAQEVVDAVLQAYINNPASALVLASLTDYDSGGGATIPGTLDRTNLSGGDPLVHEKNHGVNIRFVDDGSPLREGDRFEVEVSYYQGDHQELNVNANVATRIKMNVTGEEALGSAMAEDNILDCLARLEFALRQHDTEMVAAELPKLDLALEKLTTQMAQTGVRVIRNQFTFNVLDSTKTNSTERLSRYEDLDFENAITRLQTLQTAYQATLASTAMVTRLSLVDYIS